MLPGYVDSKESGKMVASNIPKYFSAAVWVEVCRHKSQVRAMERTSRLVDEGGRGVFILEADQI